MEYIGKKPELETFLQGYSENEEAVEHYGVKRRSGRYEWGSGDDPYQHELWYTGPDGKRIYGDFVARYDEAKNSGKYKTEIELAKALGCSSTTQLRKQLSNANANRRRIFVATAESLVNDDGLTPTEAARKMSERFGRDISESSVRNWLNKDRKINMNKAQSTADFLRQQVDEKGIIDIGKGVERELGDISRTKFDAAVKLLEDEGYVVKGLSVKQVTNKNQNTHLLVLAPPGTTSKEVYEAKDNAEIKTITEYSSNDGGATYWKAQYPESINSKRVFIRYNEDGGLERDGTIELRKGVEDISIGNMHAAQVRISVDGTHYMKGMAFYSDEVPAGYDIVYNTNKHTGTDPKKVFKELKVNKLTGEIDKDNPFGATIKIGGQREYIGEDGKKHLSLINRLKDEGDWQDQQKTLSAQFLGKQNKDLITKQLNLSYAEKEEEYNTINSLTNPTIKRYYLKKFADECDSSAADLKAAGLPGMQWHAIAPVNSLKDNEIYAPNYTNGTQVALVRYPHAGTFEIPILTVNNKNQEGKKFFGNAKDIVGINHKNADKLSGADFDGDSVMVIPTNNGKTKISGTESLEGLKGFDPKERYSTSIDSKGRYISDTTGKVISPMSDKTKQKQMGVVSNLITDMTLKGANDIELAKAVRHSMVVIDAEKHKLDWKQSEVDNDILSLKKKYQSHLDDEKFGGASTLLSRAGADVRVPKRQGTPHINIKGKYDYDPTRPEGAYIYKEAKDARYIDRKTGKPEVRTIEVNQMSLYDDANALSSGRLKEKIYANYCNKLKALANKARKEYATSTGIKYNSDAAKKYALEVDQLKSALNIALLNAPRERQAQILANKRVAERTKAQDLSRDSIKKIKQQELEKARSVYSAGSQARKIKITDRQWEAIQNGAVSDKTLMEILGHSDPKVLRELSMPKQSNVLPASKVNLMKSMESSGYTTAEIADRLGISSATVSKYLREE